MAIRERLSPEIMKRLVAIAKEAPQGAPLRRVPDLAKLIREWQGAPSLTVVARKMDLSVRACGGIGQRLRRRGIPLKHFAARRWSNALMREYSKYASALSTPAQHAVSALRRRVRDLEAECERLRNASRVRVAR